VNLDTWVIKSSALSTGLLIYPAHLIGKDVTEIPNPEVGADDMKQEFAKRGRTACRGTGHRNMFVLISKLL
jgi:hypothetical protein